jgi:hypothetical protein
MGMIPEPASRSATRKQKALRILEQLVPGRGVNNVPVAFQVQGRLDAVAVEQALALLLRRYQVLRTVFSVGDLGLQKRILDPGEAALKVAEITSEGDQDAALRDFAAEPFEFDGGLLLRAGLLHGSDGDICCLTAHHMIFDARSVTIFLTDFIAAYDALATGAQPPAHLAEEVLALAEDGPQERTVAYWRTHLNEFDPRGLDLAIGQPGDSLPTLIGGHVERMLSPQTAQAVAQAQKTLGAPQATILLATFCVLLTSHGASHDLVIGCPLDARRGEGRSAIGYHVSTAPLRVTASPGQTFGELVKQARNTFLEALSHLSASYEDILPYLPRRGTTWRDRLIRYQFNYLAEAGTQPFHVGLMPAALLDLSTGFSKFDLEIFISSAPGTLGIKFVYDTDIFSPDDAELMLDRFDALLLELTTDPARTLGDTPPWCPRDTDVITAARTSASVTVRDHNGHDLPIGMRGELYLTGLGTADQATSIPARWRPDGTLELLGTLAPHHPEHGPQPGIPASGQQWEAEMVGLWRELLGKPDLGADAHFFYSGGHSILAAQLAQKAGELAGVQLQLITIFEHPTPAGLAAALRTMTTEPQSGETAGP